MKCQANIILPFEGEDVVVTLDVDFTIDNEGIEDFTAKVVEADLECVTQEDLAEMQAYFDANDGKYVEQINNACYDSLMPDDDREAIQEGDYHYYRSQP